MNSLYLPHILLARPTMIGVYTVMSEKFMGSKLIISHLYMGEEISEKNKVEITSRKNLDIRIAKLMRMQGKRLKLSPELNRIEQTIQLDNL